MSWLGWALVIFLIALVTYLGTAVLTGRQPRVPLERLADPAPLPGELPRAGHLDMEYLPGPPFAFDRTYGGKVHDIHGGPGQDCWCGYIGHDVDTGPLLILSDKMAANAALEREIEQRCAEAEAKIPPRWRS